jgi:hypothetical protein
VNKPWNEFGLLGGFAAFYSKPLNSQKKKVKGEMSSYFEGSFQATFAPELG